MAQSTQLHPQPVKVGGPKKNALTKAMEKGVKALPTDQKPSASLPEDHASDEYGAGGSGSGESSGSCSSFVASSSPSSEQDTDEDNFQQDRRQAKQARMANLVHPYEQGQILINNAGRSLDVRCHTCAGGFDRSWLSRDNARQAHTKAQGRMLGAYFAWLDLPCCGDRDVHEAQFSETGPLYCQSWVLQLILVIQGFKGIPTSALQ